MHDTMNIVPITERNWHSLKAVRLESLIDSPDAFGLTYQDAKEISKVKWQSIASGKEGLKFFLARSGGEIVGLVGGFHIAEEYELVSMWVRPEKRNNGIGGQLIKELLNHAKSQGSGTVALHVSLDNKVARKLYAKAGFIDAEEKNDRSGEKLKKMVWHSAPASI